MTQIVNGMRQPPDGRLALIRVACAVVGRPCRTLARQRVLDQRREDEVEGRVTRDDTGLG